MTTAALARSLLIILCFMGSSFSTTNETEAPSPEVTVPEIFLTTEVFRNATSDPTSTLPLSFLDTTGNRSCLQFPVHLVDLHATTVSPDSTTLTTWLAEHTDDVVCDDEVNRTFPHGDNTTSSSGTSNVSAVPSRNVFDPFALINSGSVTKEMADTITRVVNWVNLPVCLTGVVLNIFNVAVYAQASMRSASSTYLAVLCTAELLYLVFFITVIANSVIFGAEALFNYIVLVMGISIGLYALVVVRRITFVLTLVVSFERFVAVAFPLKCKGLRVSSHPGRIAAAVIVLIALIHFNILAKYDIIPLGNDRYTIKTRPFFADNDAVFTTYSNLWRIVLVYVPLVATIFLNVLTTVFMRRHRKASKKLTTNRDMARNDKAEAQTTIAIIVSTLLFVFFSLPSNVVALFIDFHPTYGFMKKEHYLYVSIGRFFTTLELISNFVDFVSYITLSRRFLVTFKKLFCHRCIKDDAPKPTSTVTAQSSSQTQVSEFSACATKP